MSREEEEDAGLLERVRGGDEQALSALLERYQAQIYRFGLSMCRDPEDARDVLQDTLFAMAKGVRDFRGASSLSTWLFAVARSFCIKKRRRSRFAPAQEHSLDGAAGREALQVADEARSPQEALEGKQLEAALEEAITALEPKYREVLLLRDVEGLTAPEVAEVVGISVQAVKSRLHRARLRVREALAPLLDVDEGAPSGEGACPDVLSLFSRHREGEISAEVCARMERHLAVCPRCRSACDTLKETLALCRTSGGRVSVPEAVQRSVRAAIAGLLAER